MVLMSAQLMVRFTMGGSIWRVVNGGLPYGLNPWRTNLVPEDLH